jgi:hypothetical protein
MLSELRNKSLRNSMRFIAQQRVFMAHIMHYE